MAYNKNVWQNGDVITAEKLNNLEDGVASFDGEGNERFIITFTQNEGTCSADKTLTEISNAWSDGKEIFGAKVGWEELYFFH